MERSEHSEFHPRGAWAGDLDEALLLRMNQDIVLSSSFNTADERERVKRVPEKVGSSPPKTFPKKRDQRRQ